MNIILDLICFFNIYHASKWIQEIICRKPNAFWNVIAPPGTGKTSLCAHLLRQAKKEHKKVYSNRPIRGAIYIDIKNDLGKYNIHDSIVLIDESGSDLGNRDWQNNLSKESIKFIKLHRHYNVDIYTFSQAPNDMDKKFRDLVTRVYLLYKSKIPFYVRAQSLKQVMKLEGGQIVQYLEEEKSESFRFFTPPTWAYFNSWDKNMILKEMDEHVYMLTDM